MEGETLKDILRYNSSRDATVRDSSVRGTMRENDSLKEIPTDNIGNVTLRDHTRRENTIRDIGAPQTSNPKTFLSSAKTFLSSAAAAAKHNGETTFQLSLPHLRTQFPTNPKKHQTQNPQLCAVRRNPSCSSALFVSGLSGKQDSEVAR